MIVICDTCGLVWRRGSKCPDLEAFGCRGKLRKLTHAEEVATRLVGWGRRRGWNVHVNFIDYVPDLQITRSSRS